MPAESGMYWIQLSLTDRTTDWARLTRQKESGVLSVNLPRNARRSPLVETVARAPNQWDGDFSLGHT